MDYLKKQKKNNIFIDVLNGHLIIFFHCLHISHE